MPGHSLILLTMLLSWPAASVLAARPADDSVLFMQAARAPVGQVALLEGFDVRLLNDSADGRQVAVAELGPGVVLRLPADRSQTAEIFVLAGAIGLNETRLGKYGYAHLPADAAAPMLTSGETGASLLLFLDPRRETDGEALRLLDSAALPWRPGTVAQQDTGIALALEVKDLLSIESTGQRTWLLRLGPDFDVGWEVHESAEEGFLIEGDYHMAECLPDGSLFGEYEPGGYFYRPAGIAHGGPRSGSDTGAFWLLRTPARLTVEFVDTCP